MVLHAEALFTRLLPIYPRVIRSSAHVHVCTRQKTKGARLERRGLWTKASKRARCTMADLYMDCDAAAGELEDTGFQSDATGAASPVCSEHTFADEDGDASADDDDGGAASEQSDGSGGEEQDSGKPAADGDQLQDGAVAGAGAADAAGPGDVVGHGGELPVDAHAPVEPVADAAPPVIPMANTKLKAPKVVQMNSLCSEFTTLIIGDFSVQATWLAKELMLQFVFDDALLAGAGAGAGAGKHAADEKAVLIGGKLQKMSALAMKLHLFRRGLSFDGKKPVLKDRLQKALKDGIAVADVPAVVGNVMKLKADVTRFHLLCRKLPDHGHMMDCRRRLRDALNGGGGGAAAAAAAPPQAAQAEPALAAHDSTKLQYIWCRAGIAYEISLPVSVIRFVAHERDHGHRDGLTFVLRDGAAEKLAFARSARRRTIGELDGKRWEPMAAEDGHALLHDEARFAIEHQLWFEPGVLQQRDVLALLAQANVPVVVMPSVVDDGAFAAQFDAATRLGAHVELDAQATAAVHRAHNKPTADVVDNVEAMLRNAMGFHVHALPEVPLCNYATRDAELVDFMRHSDLSAADVDTSGSEHMNRFRKRVVNTGVPKKAGTTGAGPEGDGREPNVIALRALQRTCDPLLRDIGEFSNAPAARKRTKPPLP